MDTGHMETDGAHAVITLGTVSVETKGGGVLPQPDSNQPARQGIGIQQD